MVCLKLIALILISSVWLSAVSLIDVSRFLPYVSDAILSYALRIKYWWMKNDLIFNGPRKKRMVSDNWIKTQVKLIDGDDLHC